MVRRNSRVRISQRTTLHHWLIEQRQVAVALNPLLYVRQMIVSDVGRMTSVLLELRRRATTLPSPRPV